MSTDYGLHCKDCNKSTFYGGDFDTHWELILQIWKARETLAKVNGLIRQLEKLPIDSIEVRVSLDYGNSWPTQLFKFLEKHQGHNILILDEYGNLKNENYDVIGKANPYEEDNS